MDKISYALGLSIGNNFTSSGITKLDMEQFVAGVRDVLEEQEKQLTYDEAKSIIEQYFKKLQEEKFENNRAAGAEYQMVNGHRDDVTTLPSGLQYQILKKGDGTKHPQATDKVTCHYHGTLINGTVFDSSKERGEPATFPVNGVIQGWQEVLPLMVEETFGVS